MKTIKNKTL